MSSVFSKIISREISGHIVAENENFIAFLDINPLQKGHTLVVPKKEVDYIFNLNDQLLSKLHIFAKKVALAIQKVIPCNRIGVTVMGLEIPHAHIHLIPINTLNDMNFKNPPLKFSENELSEITSKIKAAMESK